MNHPFAELFAFACLIYPSNPLLWLPEEIETDSKVVAREDLENSVDLVIGHVPPGFILSTN